MFRRNGLVVSLIATAAIAAVLALTMGLRAPEALYRPRTGPGAFYAVIPHAAMALGAVLALFIVLPYSKFVHGIYRPAALRTPL